MNAFDFTRYEKNNSTRFSEHGVFTQPGSRADIRDDGLSSEAGHLMEFLMGGSCFVSRNRGCRFLHRGAALHLPRWRGPKRGGLREAATGRRSPLTVPRASRKATACESLRARCLRNEIWINRRRLCAPWLAGLPTVGGACSLCGTLRSYQALSTASLFRGGYPLAS
jgi:hypothetical protein